jgi:lactate dehydrogenase-like 2-hydroxyacid dehydrogenase
MIALMRQIPSVDREVKCGRWPTPMTRVLRGKTLGIIGLGYVGRHVTKIARAFEMNVLAWGPRLTPQVAASVKARRCLATNASRLPPHFSAVPTAQSNVRYQGETRRHMLNASSSHFDPNRTWGQRLSVCLESRWLSNGSNLESFQFGFPGGAT